MSGIYNAFKTAFVTGGALGYRALTKEQPFKKDEHGENPPLFHGGPSHTWPEVHKLAEETMPGIHENLHLLKDPKNVNTLQKGLEERLIGRQITAKHRLYFAPTKDRPRDFSRQDGISIFTPFKYHRPGFGFVFTLRAEDDTYHRDIVDPDTYIPDGRKVVITGVEVVPMPDPKDKSPAMAYVRGA